MNIVQIKISRFFGAFLNFYGNTMSLHICVPDNLIFFLRVTRDPVVTVKETAFNCVSSPFVIKLKVTGSLRLSIHVSRVFFFYNNKVTITLTNDKGFGIPAFS